MPCAQQLIFLRRVTKHLRRHLRKMGMRSQMLGKIQATVATMMVMMGALTIVSMSIFHSTARRTTVLWALSLTMKLGHRVFWMRAMELTLTTHRPTWVSNAEKKSRSSRLCYHVLCRSGHFTA
eukprot:Rmarinus@m.23308